MTRQVLAVFWTCLGLAMAACGGGADGGADAAIPDEPPSFPLATTQEELDEAGFVALAAEDADIESLRATLAAEGFATFVAAGTIGAEDGVRLDFASYADGSGAVRSVIRHCRGEDCTRALAYEEEGGVRWVASDGSPLEPRHIPLPNLLRERTVENGPTRLVSALSGEPPVDPASIDLSRRRLIVLDQFGRTTGLPSNEVVGDAAASGRFGEVVTDEHAGLDAVRDAIITGYPHETLVWVGQPIRLKYRDSVSKDQPPWYKTVGMGTAAGIYGLRVASSEEVANAFGSAPFSGPGVVLLVGSESLGDGTPGMEVPASMAQRLALPGKVVAGFVGDAHPAVLLAVARAFLLGLGAGRTAAEARDEANALPEKWGLPVRLAFAPDSDEALRLPPAADFFWAGRPPVSADLKLYLHLRLYCAAEPGGKETPVPPEMQGNGQFPAMQVEGPVFRGHMEVQTGETDFRVADVVGVLGELRQGGHFHFVFQGDVKEGFEDITFYANAAITSVKEQGTETVVRFGGTAQALPFEGPNGKHCTLHDLDLEPMIEGPYSSELVLKY